MSEDYCGLYEQEQARLVSWLHQRANSYDRALDLSQIIWLKLWRYRDTIQEWSTGVVYRMAKNVLVDHYRKVRVETCSLDQMGRYEEIDPMSVALDRISAEAILAVAASVLTPVYHETMVMWAAGQSYEEISVTLRIPVGTVRSRLNHARNRMKEHRRAV